MKLSGNPPDEVVHAWEDVKAMFNGGTRKRLLNNPTSRESPSPAKQPRSSPTAQIPTLVPSPTHPRVPPFPELPLPLSRSLVMDYVWHQHQQAAAVAAAKTPGFPFSPYALPWLAKRGPVLFPGEFVISWRFAFWHWYCIWYIIFGAFNCAFWRYISLNLVYLTGVFLWNILIWHILLERVYFIIFKLAKILLFY